MDKATLDKYELVVGLEVHAQLQTSSKIFSSDANAFGQEPNTNISVITLAHPGTLPKANKKVLEYAIKMGLACNSRISEYNIFDRKNYFYPDLPKGYQTTQDKTPICMGGHVEVKTKEGTKRNIALNRIHMEEDAGKSIHLEGEPDTLVDLNRAGVPLIEIVSEPDIRQAEEAHSYLTEVRKLVRYLDICDGNMEEGSMRCDANISIRLKGAAEYGKKVEVKNMNSIRNVQRAIEHEFVRQVEIIENGGTIDSETRTFNAQDGSTSGMRSKETLNDYRYFPCPDLPPLIVSEEWIQSIRKGMPSLPKELFEKFTNTYGLPEYDAQVLTDQKDIAFFFEALCSKTNQYKVASNWMMGPIKSCLNDKSISMEEFPLSAEQIASIIELVEENKVSYTAASNQLLPKMMEQPETTAETLAHQLDLIQDSDDDSIIPIIEQALAKFPDKVKAYQSGKKNLLGLFMGEVMKLSNGKVDPKKANQLIREVLEK
ncbi:Asp-tRNA(Asn)/Glu-tRNA(Gln) amidotransferase subunit GatB [Limibacter armeniacum]|uniref:Asp-tRNA(Asn)/Glu-tRNA(Gln) amidotransferase subunit GatB n=1 Tax=Limibacter armeniacum TaxID=466084 RepID=UPI002FE5C7E5